MKVCTVCTCTMLLYFPSTIRCLCAVVCALINMMCALFTVILFTLPLYLPLYSPDDSVSSSVSSVSTTGVGNPMLRSKKKVKSILNANTFCSGHCIVLYCNGVLCMVLCVCRPVLRQN